MTISKLARFVLSLSLIISLKGTAQTMCFNPNSVTNYTMSFSGSNYSIASADLDGDGKKDLIAGFMDSVHVRPGIGDGTFGTKTKYWVGQNPRYILPADISGDSKIDLLIASANSNQLTVLINNGSGGFLPYSLYTSGATPVAIASADFNADGKPDVAVLNQSSKNISVFLNSGSGAFNPAVNYTIGFSNLESIACIDIDNDGIKDLVASNYTSTLYILTGTGTGTFNPYTTFTPANTSSRLLAKDVDADGDTDLITVGYNDNTMSLLLNDGIPSTLSMSGFGYPTPYSPADVSYDDFNGDGIMDIAAINDASSTGGDFSIFTGVAAGTFNAPVYFNTTGYSTLGGVAADFNNDGRADFATRLNSASNINITLSTAYTVSITPSMTTLCEGSPVNLAASANAASTYTWNNGSNSNTLTDSPFSTTTYTLEGSSYECYDTAQVTITVNVMPALGSFTPSDFCENSAPITIDAPIAGSAPFMYTTSGAGLTLSPPSGSTGNNLSLSASGISGVYQPTITVTDANGCVTQAVAFITIYPAPLVSVSGNTLVCPNALTTLTASGADSYSWDTGDLGDIVSVAPSGITVYTVTGTTLQGCSATAAISLDVFAVTPLTITASNTMACNVANVDFTITPSGTYTINPGGQTGDMFSVSPTSTTMYDFETYDVNGCYIYDAITITVGVAPVAGANSNSPLCEGKTLMLNDASTISSGSIVSHLWEGPNGFSSTQPSTFASATTSISGTYSLTVTSDLGCTNTTTLSVTINPVPAIAITGPSLTCTGNVTLVATGGDTYMWGGGQSNDTLIVYVDNSSPYFANVLGNVSATGCGAFANLQVDALPSQDLNGVVTSTVGPTDGEVILYKYSPFLTRWDSITRTPYTGGSYSFTAVDSGLYVVKAVPTPTLEQITYGGSSISWQGANTITHGCTNASTQNIAIVGFDNIGTGIGFLSGTVTEASGFGNKSGPGGINSPQAPGNPIGGIIVKGGKNPGGTMLVQTITNSVGQYTLSGFPINTGDEFFILVDIPGLDTSATYHRFLITGNEQYTNLDFIVDSVKVYPVGIATSVSNSSFISDNTVTVFPNPAKNNVSVNYSLNTQAQVQIELLDIVGKSVETLLPQTQQPAGNNKLNFSLNNLSSGLYFIKLSINREDSYIKLQITD